MSEDWTGKLLFSITFNFVMIVVLLVLLLVVNLRVTENTEFREKMQTWGLRK